MLRNLNLKAVYRTEEDNILEDFYLPALSVANSYDRAVGFFSAAMLSYAAKGLSAFVRNDGKMRLIIGCELEAEDEQAIREGYEVRDVAERVGVRIVRAIENVDDALFSRRLEALSWLVASGRLDIKVAMRKKGMYHEKIGIIRDAEGDAIVFQGSANESVSALVPDFNFESINVFPCWREELSPHFTPYLSGFEKLWENRSRNTIVVQFPDAARQKLLKIAQNCRVPTPELEIELASDGIASGREPGDGPRLPKVLSGGMFEMRAHQLESLRAWKSHAFQGILAHATGSGKTITAIYGAVRVFEATEALALGISVPYQNLADQWVAALQQFNIVPIRCYMAREVWQSQFSLRCTLFREGSTKFICFVVVNRTLCTPEFQEILQGIPGRALMWVGDECHHHGTLKLANALPQQARMRLGLSATPEHYVDSEATERLKDFYGDIVSQFTLEEAIKAKVITPYRYFVVAVDLTESEVDAYREISGRISKLAAMRQVGDVEICGDEQLKTLLAKRSRLLGTASGKVIALQRLLGQLDTFSFTLFYCGDGSTEDEDTGELLRHVDQVSSCVYERGVRCAHFTARETREERERLLDSFRLGQLDALVAIRCLDEGIDVPACRTAFLLASSRNPKQFIQRRGRILRRAEGKDCATIYDFLVRFPDDLFSADVYERQLVQAELKRVAEFARLATNAGEAVRDLLPLLKRCDLAHLLV